MPIPSLAKYPSIRSRVCKHKKHFLHPPNDNDDDKYPKVLRTSSSQLATHNTITRVTTNISNTFFHNYNHHKPRGGRVCPQILALKSQMLTQQIVIRCQDPSILQAMKAILQNVKILQGLRNIGTKHHNSSVRIAILHKFLINIFMPWIGRHLALLMLWTIFSRCQDHSPQQNRLPCCISSCILQVPLLVYPVIFWNRPPKVAMAQPVLKRSRAGNMVKL